MVDITLNKAKYRRPGATLHRDKVDPPEGTNVYRAGRFHSRARTNNATGKKGKKSTTIGPRMRAYWGNVAR